MQKNTFPPIVKRDRALLQCLRTNGYTGPETMLGAERNAAILTPKTDARDPSAIPSICHISAALQSTAGQTFPSICRIFAAL
ncbi:hypothetical protein DM860_001190 [Cuscuta australis]|uniref:Uncharacterized protein n=1 Tax=Cuscuta australis TaxID=267555 RepID=A0A328DU96_9ASTE|nr:hypothetical protein DM860_001190 [Cuscuta australis]